jgi:hypothetical protein
MNEFFIFLNDNNLTPNGFYVLHNMVNKITSYNVNTYHEQHKLSLNGYLNALNSLNPNEGTSFFLQYIS